MVIASIDSLYGGWTLEGGTIGITQEVELYLASETVSRPWEVDLWWIETLKFYMVFEIWRVETLVGPKKLNYF